MQREPHYDDLLGEISGFLAERMSRAVEAGVDEDVIWLDPGIGFGKTVEHNLELIDRVGELRELGRPVVLGASRKSFIGKLGGREVDERLGGSLAAAVVGRLRGADVLRVHDVRATREAVLVTEAIIGDRPWRREPAASEAGA